MGPEFSSETEDQPCEVAVFSGLVAPVLPFLCLVSPLFLPEQLLLIPTESHECTQTPLHPSKLSLCVPPVIFLERVTCALLHASSVHHTHLSLPEHKMCHHCSCPAAH